MIESPTMPKMNGSTVDLNLLTVLEVLLLEGHVTRAARRAHLSQPAASRALRRLRELFDDELLVRVGQRMRLTPKAEALLPAVQRVLAEVRALTAPSTFSPSVARGVVRLAAPDIITYMLGPPLLARLQRDAPGLDFEILQWSSAWRDQLANGEVDLTFGQAAPTDRGVHSSLVVRNEWATVLRKGHPALRRRWNLDTFLGLRHLMIGFTPHGGGHVDTALSRLGRSRRVGLRMPYVVLSPLLIAESDLVLTTARWLAEKFARPMGLVLRPPPPELRLAPVDLTMVWHDRTHHDPTQRWLRGVLVELARDARMVPPAAQTSGMVPGR
jgi:DNA-binding transcriptional LysR family regulator